MALTFNTKIELATGLEVSDAYARVAAVDNASGTKITAAADIYSSSSAFEAGKPTIDVSFSRVIEFEYNRETMGTDILTLSHDALVEYFASLGYSTTKVL